MKFKKVIHSYETKLCYLGKMALDIAKFGGVFFCDTLIWSILSGLSASS